MSGTGGAGRHARFLSGTRRRAEDDFDSLARSGLHASNQDVRHALHLVEGRVGEDHLLDSAVDHLSGEHGVAVQLLRDPGSA